MRVCYVDFWPGFDKDSNWFNLLLKGAFPEKQFEFINNPELADIIFASSFGSERFKYINSKALKIFYTGENERAELSFADYSLSFDFDSYGGRNFRLPHWYLYVNWWNEPNFPHARISIEQLNKNWNPEEIWNRPNFCSIVIGNPVQNRIDVAFALDNYKNIHGFGKVFGNQYSGCKVKLLENYRWNICFENSITKGYITEKLFEAKIAGCVPIYYGDRSVSEDFNPDSFINYLDFSSTDDLVDHIRYYENNKKEFLKLARTSLFNNDKRPTLDGIYEFLRNII